MTPTATEIRIPPLASGGIMLGYRCTNRCKHCLDRCSQAPTPWMTQQTLDQTFAALADEKRLAGVHLAGGEATLNMPLLQAAIAAARRHRVPLDYLETNAAWATDDDIAHQRFRQLRQAGLDAVLISATPFHNEFIPLERTARAIAAARDVFGRAVIVWLGQLYQAMTSLDPTSTHSLDEFLDALGLADEPERLRGMFPLTPGGRVAEELRFCYQARPAEAWRDETCAGELTSVSHFHIDPQGCLFTGLCPGIVAADVSDLHPTITPRTHPITTTLAGAGPWGLMELARREADFAPRDDGYVSKCDLCLDVRKHLRNARPWPELRSDGFYAD